MRGSHSSYKILGIIALLLVSLVAVSVASAAPKLETSQSTAMQTGLSLYAGPGTNYGVVGTVVSGQDVSLIGRNEAGTWIKVQTTGGVQGWLSASYIQSSVPVSSLPVVSSAATTSTTTTTTATTTTTTSGPTAVIATGALHIRSGPGISYSSLTVVYQGQVVTLLGRNSNNSWAKVRAASGTEGWVNVNYIQPSVGISTLPVLDTGVPAATATAVVATGALNVRSGPDLAYTSIAVVYQGQVVTLLGRNSDSSWAKVRLSNGTEGWVNASLIQPNVTISSLPVVDSTVPAPTPTAVINTGYLNVRSGPGVEYSIITAVPSGATVNLLGRNSNSTWVKVRTVSGTEGWVNASLIIANVGISSLPVTEQNLPNPNPTAIVNTAYLNVRSGPGVTYTILTSVVGGTTVSLLGRNGDSSWVQVKLPNGTVGWVNASLVIPSIFISNLAVTG